MGESFGNSNYYVNENGEIIRKKKCPKCGRSLLSEGEYCEFCGARLQGNISSKNNGFIKIFIIFIVIIVGIVVVLVKSGKIYEWMEQKNVPLDGEFDDINKEQDTPKESKDQTVPYGYVDLGLPSGTLWKSQNEAGDYYYRNAFELFGQRLPSKNQWEELQKYGKWTWGNDENQKGYWVKGTNGNSIFLPAACPLYDLGEDESNHNIEYEYIGRYISSDRNYEYHNYNDDEYYDTCFWIFYFNDTEKGGEYDRCEFYGWGLARLVYEN